MNLNIETYLKDTDELFNNGYRIDHIHFSGRLPYDPLNNNRYYNSPVITIYSYNSDENAFMKNGISLDSIKIMSSDDVIDIMNELGARYCAKFFYIFEDRWTSYIEAFNEEIMKPVYSGKYKDSLRLTKPYKGINNSNNYFYGMHIQKNLYVNRHTKSISEYNIDKYNNTKSALYKKIITMYDQCIANLEAIKIPEIRSFSISVNARKIEYVDFRAMDGTGINLSMIPDSALISEAINNCVSRIGKDYVNVGNRYFYVHNIEKYFNFEVKTYSNGNKHLRLTHKLNNIDSNTYVFTVEDLQKIMDVLTNNEEKDFVESLILLVELA